jgi:hypothetical protein
MASFKESLGTIGESFSQLSPRERVMVAGLVVTFFTLAIGMLGYFITDGLDKRQTRIDKQKNAIELLIRHADALRDARLADARTDARIQESVPMLQGHIDKIAEQVEVDVKEYKSLKPKHLGKKKRYLEKSVRLRIYGVGIDPLSRFMDKLEGGRHLIQITRLDIQTRTGQPELLDVDMVVSTYEIAGSEGKKGSKGGKGGARPTRRGSRRARARRRPS